MPKSSTEAELFPQRGKTLHIPLIFDRELAEESVIYTVSSLRPLKPHNIAFYRVTRSKRSKRRALILAVRFRGGRDAVVFNVC